MIQILLYTYLIMNIILIIYVCLYYLIECDFIYDFNKDIPWNHKFKVNEYYNQFSNNLKILINT